MFRSPGRGAVAVAAAFTIALAGASSAQAATFNVTSTEDRFDDNFGDGVCRVGGEEGKCTLRAAIAEANTTSAADSIVLPAGIYRIQYAGERFERNENFNEVGDLDVWPESGALTITGAGAKRTVISGGSVDRVFDVGPGAGLKLDSVTVRDGYVAQETEPEPDWPTPIEKEPLPPLQSVKAGDLADLSALTSDLPAGVSFVDPCGCFPQSGVGGGIRVNPGADLEVVESTIAYNTVTLLGVGGGIGSGGDTGVSLLRTKLHRNSAGLAGGGVYNGGELTATDSTFSENAALISGGGIHNDFRFALDGTTINGNAAALAGGGIATYGVPSGGGGGGAAAVAAEELSGANTIVNSTLTDNAVRFGQGGAIYEADDWLSIENSTIADNMLVNLDLLDVLLGGQPYLAADMPILSSGRGAAIFDTGSYEGQTGFVEFSNTIIANNTDRGLEDNCESTNSEFAPFYSHGHNLDSGESCNFRSQELDESGTDLEITDPDLDELRDNGGPTYTRALLDTSPAIDAGGPNPIQVSSLGEVPVEEKPVPELDQRGGNRPEPVGSPGDKPDIGAYEANSLADLSVDSLTDAPDAVVVGKSLHLNVVVRNSGPDVIHGVKLANELPAGAVASKPAACSANGTSCDLGDLAPGETRTFETVVTPSATGTAASKATISAAGITDTDAANDSKSTSTTVEAAPVAPTNNVVPPANNPQQPLDNTPQDKDIDLNVKVPNTITLNQFFNGITVEADCGDEECLRKFREHAAINTGATRIAGFNLTVSRMSLGFNAKKNKVKLQPCKSGSTNGKRHKRCLKNLRKAAAKAKPFRVKIVVVAVDKAGNRTAQKAFITVK